MSEIPTSIRTSPKIFYVAAVVYFVGSIALFYVQMSGVQEPDWVGQTNAGFSSVYRAATLMAWLQAAYGAALLAGIGIGLRVLLGIWSALVQEQHHD